MKMPNTQILFYLMNFYRIRMEDGKSETKLNFRYFIKMALQKKISWETLVVFLDDLTPTLVQSKQAIEVLVKELQSLQSKVQNDEVDKDEIVEIVEIINNEASNATIQKAQLSAAGITNTNQKSFISQFEKDVSDGNTEISKPEVVSQNDEVNLTSTGNGPEFYNSEKVVPDAVEVFQLDDDVELPNQVIERNCNKSNANENDLTKEIENGTKLSFQINGEDCSIEFEESIDSLNDIHKASNDLPTIVDENIGTTSTSINENNISNQYNSNVNVEEEISNDNFISKPYRCKNCPKCFRNSFNLKNHEIIHTGVKPFQCKTCSKAFYHSSDCKRHERTHTGEKPFQCKTCSKSFSQSGVLKIHKRTHTGEKPFKCKTCSKAFYQLSDYKRHETTHTVKKIWRK